MTDIKSILEKAIEVDASDVHINVGLPPVLRKNTELIDMEFDSPDEAKKYAKKKGLKLTEAMSGKRNFGFQGKDEIGDFWVVLNPTSGNEVMEDIFFKADIFDMMLQQRGGLEIPSIQGPF